MPVVPMTGSSLGAVGRVWQITVLSAASFVTWRNLPGCLTTDCLDERPADPIAPLPTRRHAVGGSKQAGSHASARRPQGHNLILI